MVPASPWHWPRSLSIVVGCAALAGALTLRTVGPAFGGGTGLCGAPTVKPPQGPCHGFYPTVWRPWPLECQMGCAACATGVPTPAEVVPGEQPFPQPTESELVPPPPEDGAAPLPLEGTAIPPLPSPGPARQPYLDPPTPTPATDQAPVPAPPAPGNESLFGPDDDPATAPLGDPSTPLPDESPDLLIPPTPDQPVVPQSSETSPWINPPPSADERIHRLPPPSKLASRAPLLVAQRTAGQHPSQWSRHAAAATAAVPAETAQRPGAAANLR